MTRTQASIAGARARAWACAALVGLATLSGACRSSDAVLTSKDGGAAGTGAGTAGAAGTAPNGGPAGAPAATQIDAPPTKLPALPAMVHVAAAQGEDSAAITFDPVEGALDYRVYPLPADGDITVAADHGAVIQNATYRCAGNREAAPLYKDAEAMLGGSAIHTLVDQQQVGGFIRTLAGATIGHVYTDPGAGRVPVYALGESDPNGDSTCYFARWSASRVKIYTTSETERTNLLARFFRDDGIAFYVPAVADAATTATVYMDEKHDQPQWLDRWYFPDGPEADAHTNKTPAFQVLTAPAAGTQPLMRVFYGNSCGWSHDELAVGKERFNRIYNQGDKLPSFTLLWTGLTAPTTLVVEALDAGCPYQGYLSTQAMPGQTVQFGGVDIVHPPWVTLDDVRAAAPAGEVFINGQAAATNKPKAIARSFIHVAPVAHPKMDFFAGFAPGSTNEAFTTIPCGVANCFQTWRQQSTTWDQMFINAESAPAAAQPSLKGEGLFTFGPMLGELWVSYADVAADTNGKYRLTARQKGEMSASSFLHVTMEVDSYTTSRRYPQILISDADVPVQYGLEKAHTLIVQPRAQINAEIDFPVSYELQVCNLRTWDVNNQCPVYDLYHVLDGAGKTVRLAPNEEFGEHAHADQRVKYDVYASASRAYLFLDGKPYGCANLPAGAGPIGPVTVTWGDALYHSAVDHTFAFHAAHMQVEQRRHFDNLGFSSGSPAPAWDETRFPCAAPIKL
jgi:hypothetical protein